MDSIYLETNKIFDQKITQQIIQIRNLSCIARLVTKAASTRKESRGTHMLIDHPMRDDTNWLKHIEFRKENVILADH
jgi:L-aspartate oxidase